MSDAAQIFRLDVTSLEQRDVPSVFTESFEQVSPPSIPTNWNSWSGNAAGGYLTTRLTAGTGITVNSVLAGPTRSEGVEQFVEAMAKANQSDSRTVEKDFFKNVRPTSLLKRFATPDEVAAMVAFVASPLSSATNGAALRVEGGLLRSIV